MLGAFDPLGVQGACPLPRFWRRFCTCRLSERRDCHFLPLHQFPAAIEQHQRVQLRFAQHLSDARIIAIAA